MLAAVCFLDDQRHLVLGVGCQWQQRRPLQSPTSDIWESREQESGAGGGKSWLGSQLGQSSHWTLERSQVRGFPAFFYIFNLFYMLKKGDVFKKTKYKS